MEQDLRDLAEGSLGASEVGSAENRWLDAVPLVWFAVLLAAYGIVALYPLDVSPRSQPELGPISPLAAAVLVLTLVAGIIRYFRQRSAGSGTSKRRGPADGGAENP